ncbi:hypothetical protein [Modestobacter roseus]|uniref:hypothetical protein n=1 Tax=Modestobacter roseus TaxID=1181884 RepID=UPI0034DEB67D
MRTTLRVLVATGLTVGAALVAPTAAAAAAERPERETPARETTARETPGRETANRAAPVGYDVSYPQCRTELPDDAAFAVVGVNGGLATTPNRCLPEQWVWATEAGGDVPGQPPVQFYVNTANPGQVRDQVTTWPELGSNRYGVCDGGNTAACSYEYGVARAAGDVRIVLAAARELRSELGDEVPAEIDAVDDVSDLAGYRWWLDVETMNTWQVGGADAERNNRATLEGMADHFTALGGEVGIYSTGYQWGRIAGSVPAGSSLTGLDSWLAGADDRTDAARRCGREPLVDGGEVTLVQYVVDDLDHNRACTPAGS